ncbi:MAG: hypothetical protein LBD11_03260 [Candidatus Peribacteria bacterium]|jgi:hypothetical protein|nr:hypothetical protein [Candidatus Peribacteria bacterium]
MTFAQQYIVFSDDFNRADSPSIGSGWVDQAGNVGSIVSNKLQILNTQQQGYNLNRIARPTHEAHLDVEVSAEFSF